MPGLFDILLGKNMAHKWHPIEDLADFGEPVHDEMRYLAEVWQEQQSDLDPEQLRLFNKKLNRKWAIETGLIERAYDLDRGTTRSLIESGISEDLIESGDDPGRIVAMLRDHENVVEGLLDFVGSRRELSVGYINEVHAALLRNQETAPGEDMFGNKTEVPLLRGKFKTMPNDPVMPSGEIHQYCPPEHVGSEMDQLIAMHKEHAERDIPPLAEAAWLHHRFTQIHPFQDGNGRVARSLASLIFIKAGWFPLVIRSKESRDGYIKALSEADNGKLSSLINLFAEAQKSAFVGALGVIQKVIGETSKTGGGTDPAQTFSDTSPEKALINIAMKKIKQRNEALVRDYETAKTVAAALHDYASKRLGVVSDQVSQDDEGEVEARVDSAYNGDEHDYYFRNQIIAVAKHLDYYANTTDYRAWLRLALKSGQQAEILVFFHGAGHQYRGIIVCSACFILRERTDEGTQLSKPQTLSDQVFQINYKESLEQAKKRFEEWLEKVISVGLRHWGDSL